jgi:hypothetical protein
MYELSEITGNLPQQYQTMLSKVSEYYPVITKATRNFNKSQSQFMNNMLTVSQPTELRSLRQILAEMTRTKQALDEAYFGIEKKRVDIKKKKHLLTKTEDEFDAELLTIEIAEVENQIATSMGYVEGAVRKISAYMTQYQTMLDSYGKTEFTEEDFEKDEERYHIMKMFEQALCAARSRQGVIDEGNHIYCYQIGISGTAAQMEVSQFLTEEGETVKSGMLPDHEKTWVWMKAMGDKYAGCAHKFCQLKGMKLMQEDSLHES